MTDNLSSFYVYSPDGQQRRFMDAIDFPGWAAKGWTRVPPEGKNAADVKTVSAATTGDAAPIAASDKATISAANAAPDSVDETAATSKAKSTKATS